LGTSNPKDRTSQFYTRDNWMTNNRVNIADQDQADRDETMSFGWYMSAPAYINPGVYQECFTPVIEGLTWMREDGRLCWNIYVEENPDLVNSYQAEIDWNMSQREIEMVPGEVGTVTFEAKNIGSATWYRQSQFPIHVGTYNPMDRMSDFQYTSIWLANNRPGDLDQEEVRPGETGSFTFSFMVPEDMPTGLYSEDFWLVAEGLTWLNVRSLDSGSPWLRLEVNVGENTNVDWINSTIESDKEVIDGDGQDAAQITVTLRNSNDAPLPDIDVDLAGKGCSIDPDEGCEDINFSSQMTDENGEAEFEFSYDGEANFIFYYNVDGQDSWNELYLAAEVENDTIMCADEICFTDNLETCTPAAFNDISQLFGMVWYEIIEDEGSEGRCVVYSQIIESDDPQEVDLSMRCHYESADQYPLLIDEDLCEGDLVDYFWELVYGNIEVECTEENYVGQTCGGGVLFDYGGVNSGYLIATQGGCENNTNEPDCSGEDTWKKKWSIQNGYIEPATLFNDGMTNTNNLWASNPPENPAADYCHELVLNGFDDWYLPAIDELEQLYNASLVVDGFADDGYWSSTQQNVAGSDDNNAFGFLFDDGFSMGGTKTAELYVRCVRQINL